MATLSFISALGGAVDAQISALADWANAQFILLFDDIQKVQEDQKAQAQAQQATIASILQFLNALWEWLHKHILNKILDLLCKIQDFLKRILAPLLCIMRWLRCLQQYVLDVYLKPMIDLIQRIRSALVIFRLLGFKWAKALDARLVKMETELTNAFLAVWSNLNRLANWINYILDPLGLIAPNVWLASIARSVGAIIGAITNAGLDPGFTGGAPSYSTPDDYITGPNVSARVQLRARVGSLPEDQAIMTSLMARNAELGF